MSDHKPRTIWPWIVGSIGTLVLYVLSIGPAFWLLPPNGQPFQATYEAVYTPVFWMADLSESLDIALCKYLSFWSGKEVMPTKESRKWESP